MSPTHFGDMIFAPRDLSIDLANGLVKRGHEVYFFTAPDVKTTAHLVGGDANLLQRDYVHAMLGNTKSERLEWGYTSVLKHNYETDLTMRCYQMAAKEGFDIIHSYHERMAHFFDELAGIPTVYTLHDPLPASELNLKYWLLQKFTHHKYVSISNAFRVHPTLQLNFVDTVYHGIRTPQVESSARSGTYLSFMARLIAEKGIEDAIETARQVCLPLKVASSKTKENTSDDGYFNTKIAPLVKESDVQFTGFMDAQGKQKFFNDAIALLFPIHWEEPFGMVMIEAMACGTPVVAYNRGSVPEIVKDGVTGFIIEPDDEASTKSQAPNPKQIQNSKFKIQKKGVEGLVEAVKRIGEIDRAACRAHVEENFTVEKMVEGYERVYKKVLGI